MFRGFRSIFYKEVIQISRDPLTLALMLLVPMIQLMVFGYAINTDVRNIKTAVYNLDPGPQSRDLLHAFENTDYFQIVRYVGSDEELNNSIVTGRVKVGIKIPPDYSDRLLANRQATVLVLIDGSDSSIATQSLQVASQVGLTESLARLGTELQGSGSRTSQLPIEVRPKMLFNPDSRSANFMVPGLIAIILQIITTLLTAFSIVREREQGTLEQLLVTPVRPFGLMLGKLVPYDQGFARAAALAVDFIPVYGAGDWTLDLNKGSEPDASAAVGVANHVAVCLALRIHVPARFDAGNHAVHRVYGPGNPFHGDNSRDSPARRNAGRSSSGSSDVDVHGTCAVGVERVQVPQEAGLSSIDFSLGLGHPGKTGLAGH